MIQVFIDPLRSFETGSLHIHVVDRTATHAIVWDGTGQSKVYQAPENTVAPQHPIILPTEAAHPLLAALAQHLGAVEHPQRLRADYDRLLARHDKLVDYLLETGKTLTDVAWAKTAGGRR